MQVKERKPSDLIIEISTIAGRLDKLTDDQLGEFGRLKDVAGELLTSVAEAESRLRAAKSDLKNLLDQRDFLTAEAERAARMGQPHSWPPYIPASILADYKECCAVQHLSPKASVMLARRCLQGMIRDFFGVCCDTLFEETDRIRGEVNEGTWALIDEVRRMGNVGAHPKHAYELARVEPGDASKSIHLLERLFTEWYVERHEAERQPHRPNNLVIVGLTPPDERPMPGRPLAVRRHSSNLNGI
jgi:hypothetical protein